MKHDVFQQMAAYGLAVEFKYGGEDRYDGNYRRTAFSSSVHVWQVKITSRRAEDCVLEDRYKATKMEHEAFRDDVTVLIASYLKAFMGRVERVRRLGEERTFTGWCKLIGVRPADLKKGAGTQEFWRSQFDRDCRASREFAELLGGDDKVGVFLSTTIR